MSLVTAIIISTAFTFLLMVLIGALVNFRNFPKYKENYNLLTSGEYKFNWQSSGFYYFSRKDLVGKFSSISKFSNLSLVFMCKDEDDNGDIGSIRLPGDGMNYIHNGIFSIDPYTFYYRRKFIKWFNDNKSTFVDRETTFEFTEGDLETIEEKQNN
jgi:hypothetical protein